MILFLFWKDATLQIDQSLDRSLVEEDLGSLSNESICVNLTDLTPGGLQRDIIVDVTTLDGTATSKHDFFF